MKNETFLDKFKKIAKDEGFSSLEGFVNYWIESGETFSSLHEWLMLNKDINVSKTLIWVTLRNYLTTSYTHEDQFWYKWNAVAKVKGFRDPKHMIFQFRKQKLCREEMAEEIGVVPHKVNPIIKRLLQGRSPGLVMPKRKYKRRNYKRSKDRDGISLKKSRIKWRNQLQKHGFKSLKDAIFGMKKMGLNYTQMANMMEVSIRGFRNRRRRAGL